MSRTTLLPAGHAFRGWELPTSGTSTARAETLGMADGAFAEDVSHFPPAAKTPRAPAEAEPPKVLRSWAERRRGVEITLEQRRFLSHAVTDPLSTTDYGFKIHVGSHHNPVALGTLLGLPDKLVGPSSLYAEPGVAPRVVV